MRIEKIVHPSQEELIEEIKIYQFDELSENVKQRLIEKEYENFEIYFYVDEWANTVKAISRLIGGRYDYEISLYRNSHLEFINYQEPEEEVYGNRAVTWIYNNWMQYTYKGKYYSKNGKHRHSKIIKDCVFTGICYDCNFWETFNLFKEEAKKGKELTVSDFIAMLEEALTHDIVDRLEALASEEGLTEYLSQNEYYEDGEIV